MPSAFSHAIVGSTLVACGLPRPRASLIALGAVVAAAPDSRRHRDRVRLGPRPSPRPSRPQPLPRRGGGARDALRARGPRPAARAPLARLAGAGPGGGVARPARCADQRRARRRLPGAVRRHALALPGAAIEVSPIGVWSFFSRRGLQVLANEVLWLWLPCLAALAATWAVRRVERIRERPRLALQGGDRLARHRRRVGTTRIGARARHSTR